MRQRARRMFLCAALLGAGCSHRPAPAPASPPQTVTMTQAQPLILGPEASPVDFERMARFPEPGWQTPRNVVFSPDGKLITYLQSESQSEEMALMAYDPATRSSRVLVHASDLA